MEEIIILIIQGIVEFLFEFFSYLPWDWWSYDWYSDEREDRHGSFVWTLIISLVIGGVLGWLSIYIFPTVLVKWGWLRIALLFISPLGSGMMARTMTQLRAENNKNIDANAHFWISLCFSVGLVWIRFAFAHRPA